MSVRGQPVVAELGADPVAVGVVELLERAQGLGPGPAGGVQVWCAAVGVAEMIEGDRFVVPVGQLPA